MRKLLSAAAAAVALLPMLAQAAEPPCLTPAEFTALANYALPSVISGTAQRCGAALGPDAYLRRSGPQLIQRYAEQKPAAWPLARSAFLKLSGTSGPDANSLIRTLPDPSLQQMADSLMAGLVAQHLPLDRCGAIDRLIGLLSPLPAQSTAEAIALAVGLGAKAGRTKIGTISVCAA